MTAEAMLKEMYLDYVKKCLAVDSTPFDYNNWLLTVYSAVKTAMDSEHGQNLKRGAWV